MTSGVKNHQRRLWDFLRAGNPNLAEDIRDILQMPMIPSSGHGAYLYIAARAPDNEISDFFSKILGRAPICRRGARARPVARPLPG